MDPVLGLELVRVDAIGLANFALELAGNHGPVHVISPDMAALQTPPAV
ncbi:hypothetical protein RCH06_003522 [Polaromonas sp. CG_9.5]|nr:hypothetical protein [Polaromonas sp. CG_9.5]